MLSIRNFHLLLALLTAGLVSGLAAPSPTWAAPGFNCDVTIPLAVEWSDYFDQVGEGLFFDDDECGLSAPFDQDTDFSNTSVTIAMDPAPHITYLSLYVNASQVELGGENKITVLRLSDPAGGISQSFIEIQVGISNKGARELRLEIKADTSSDVVPLGLARPDGNVIRMEVKKSSYSGVTDGFVIVDIGEGAGSEVLVDSLVLWESLPSEARFGVVDLEGENSAGTLVFQPIEMGYRFFSTYPQD